MTITIEFSPWGQFHARKKDEEIKRWLRAVGEAGTEAFRSGMTSFPPKSADGAWPASRSGALKGSIDFKVDNNSVTIGTSTRYSGYLRTGTSKMRRRKMSDNALKEGIKAGRLGRWVEWTRG